MKKNYQATFVLDTHNWREPIENLMDSLKKIIEEIGGQIKSVRNMGLKPFARVPRREFVEGHYVSILFEGETKLCPLLKERIRLNQNVNRVFIESVVA